MHCWTGETLSYASQVIGVVADIALFGCATGNSSCSPGTGNGEGCAVRFDETLAMASPGQFLCIGDRGRRRRSRSKIFGRCSSAIPPIVGHGDRDAAVAAGAGELNGAAGRGVCEGLVEEVPSTWASRCSSVHWRRAVRGLSAEKGAATSSSQWTLYAHV